MSLNLGLSAIPSFLHSGFASLAGKLQKWYCVKLVTPQHVALISLCPISDDGHLIKILSAKTVHH